MSGSARKSIANGIWLCRNCAQLIDADPDRFPADELLRWKRLSEDRARKAQAERRIANVGADFADTLLLVTSHKTYPAFTAAALKGPPRMRKVTYSPIRAHRTLRDLWVPFVGGPPPGPPGYGTIMLTCQNQGTGVEQFVRFGLSFAEGRSAIEKVEVKNDRVLLSEGGQLGASMVSFLVRELLPKERMSASLVARNDVPFEAHLWTQRSGESDEVFVFNVTIGDEEPAPPAAPEVTYSLGRNDPCYCGSRKKFKQCHGKRA